MSDRAFQWPHKLAGAIGRRVYFRGQPGVLVEVLEHPPTLVIRPHHAGKVIQADVHGYARRRTEDVISIEVRSSAGGFSTDYLDFRRDNPDLDPP